MKTNKIIEYKIIKELAEEKHKKDILMLRVITITIFFLIILLAIILITYKGA